ncbi:MAG: hypothetical protein K6A82_00445 [Prevotella sp.]|nr:hypothetical protein [Prevotella sp.]
MERQMYVRPRIKMAETMTEEMMVTASIPVNETKPAVAPEDADAKPLQGMSGSVWGD